MSEFTGIKVVPGVAVGDHRDPAFTEPYGDQIKRLAQFIMEEINGEPSQPQGAIDTAIRLLRWAYRPQDDVRVIDNIESVTDISINAEPSIFPGATAPSLSETPDIAEFIEPTIPTLRLAKQMSLVFFFNTEEELDAVIQGMRQMIKEDSEIEMIAVLSEKTAQIRALFEEKEDIHVDAATSTIADAGAERNQDSADLES